MLRDNIHGLELDERCTQIAAFNVALAAWKLAGYQKLPTLNIACSGLAPSATEGEWLALAGKDDHLRRGMMRLHSLFKNAPVLGSLINPRAQAGNLIEAEFHELAPLLAAALAPSENQKPNFENDALELAVIAQGLAKAAELLAGQFTLVITNVPYLKRGKQDDVLRDYCERVHPEAKADLATCFVERCLEFCSKSSGSTALVTPQSWLFLGSYRHLRLRLLKTVTWETVIRLGPHAFEMIGGEVVNVSLLTLTRCPSSAKQALATIDASSRTSPAEKAIAISSEAVIQVMQAGQLKNPDARVALEYSPSDALLQEFADAYIGQRTGDGVRFIFEHWELPTVSNDWVHFGTTVEQIEVFGGCRQVMLWENGKGQLAQYQADLARYAYASGGWKQGWQAWGKIGVRVSQMGSLPVTIHTGAHFDNNSAVIVPKNPAHLPAIWCFCSSSDFNRAVRDVDQALKVTNATLVKIPFDLANWQEVAATEYPDGLPKPHSVDPTQWLFNGHPAGSAQPLHVAISRLLGYRWPRQTGSNFLDCPALGPDGLEKFADHDGIVCLPAVNREQPAAARLRQLLTAALGTFDERAVITSAGLKGSKSKNLEDWLRDEFFEQHAKVFHDRPFIWHLWDGRADGFHALVNYHRLDHANLQKLTYSYLGDWIQQQAEGTKADKPGAAERLGAARALQGKLDAILKGEAPLDIFVRWKPLKEQAQGWHPDLNDGIRQNIRPFLLAGDVGKKGAGLFRSIPLGLKDKDRGTEPERPKKDYPWFWCEEEPGTDPKGGKDFVGNRWNDVHLTLETKRKGRGE